MASVNPSTQFGDVNRFEVPCFAASDIVAGAAVRIASSGDWAVQMCQSSAEMPLGTARDFAAAGQPVSVWDIGNIQRTLPGAGASFARESWVGVVGTSSMVHPISGVTVTYGVLGQVTATASAVGGSSTPVWAIGQAFESAATGDQAAFRINPTILSGVVAN